MQGIGRAKGTAKVCGQKAAWVLCRARHSRIAAACALALGMQRHGALGRCVETLKGACPARFVRRARRYQCPMLVKSPTNGARTATRRPSALPAWLARTALPCPAPVKQATISSLSPIGEAAAGRELYFGARWANASLPARLTLFLNPYAFLMASSAFLSLISHSCAAMPASGLPAANPVASTLCMINALPASMAAASSPSASYTT